MKKYKKTNKILKNKTALKPKVQTARFHQALKNNKNNKKTNKNMRKKHKKTNKNAKNNTSINFKVLPVRFHQALKNTKNNKKNY